MKEIEERFLRQKMLRNSFARNAETVDSEQKLTCSEYRECLVPAVNASSEVFQEFEKQQNDIFSTRSLSVDVSLEEVESLILDVRSVWDSSKFNEIFIQCRKQVVLSVVGPLGLGNFVAAYDKIGGNITTVHNAKQGIYARKDVEGFSRDEYTGGKYQTASRDYRDERLVDFAFKDEYTNKELYYKGDDNKSSVDVDHIVSTKQYHVEGGFIQNNGQRNEFGSDAGNFAITDKSINRSIKDADKSEWANSKNAVDNAKTNAEFHDIDSSSLKKAMARGQKAASKHAPTTVEWSKYYGGRVAVTGCIESGAMGLQQAMGLLITDIFEAFFTEIKDSYDNGFVLGCNANSFFEALAVRLKRIGGNVLDDWKLVLSAFKDGAISGFVSNVVTTAINAFCTTAKNIVRLIREGFFSLLKAFKTIFFRPEGTTFAEAADAALKLIAASVVTIGGISLQEYLNINLAPLFSSLPIIGSFGGVFISIIGGGITAIATSLCVYVVDKIDIFGVRDNDRHQFVIQTLRKENLSLESSIHEVFDSVINIGVV